MIPPAYVGQPCLLTPYTLRFDIVVQTTAGHAYLPYSILTPPGPCLTTLFTTPYTLRLDIVVQTTAGHAHLLYSILIPRPTIDNSVYLRLTPSRLDFVVQSTADHPDLLTQTHRSMSTCSTLITPDTFAFRYCGRNCRRLDMAPSEKPRRHVAHRVCTFPRPVTSMRTRTTCNSAFPVSL